MLINRPYVYPYLIKSNDFCQPSLAFCKSDYQTYALIIINAKACNDIFIKMKIPVFSRVRIVSSLQTLNERTNVTNQFFYGKNRIGFIQHTYLPVSNLKLIHSENRG